MPSNKQQTIAFFISAPASRPLPPPCPPPQASRAPQVIKAPRVIESRLK